jgi:carbon monoxide dehydrogenase subunit G
MNIDHEFTVPTSADRAWELLTDLEQVATCMPGAQLTGVEDDVYTGLVKIKVGPVTAQYKGTASFVEKDDEGRHAVVSAKGKEARGSGTAAATIDMRLRPDGDEHTVVSVSTDLKISGKIAQFGSGMIQEVSTKLLGQFSQCLESRISNGGTAAPAADGDTAGTAPETGVADAVAAQEAAAAASPAVTTPAVTAEAPDPGPVAAPPPVTPPAGTSLPTAPPSRPAPVAGPEPEALNLVGVVGPALLKRLAPALVGIVAVMLLIRWLRR